MFKDSKKLDRMLSKCIQSIEEKGWTIDDCLDQYPSHRTELEPLLRTALRLRQASRFGPSTAFRSSAQIRIRKRLQSSRRSAWISPSSSSSQSQRKAKTTPPKMHLVGTLLPVLLLSLFIIAMGGGLAYAADNAKPGDLLFQLDRAIEQVRIKLQNDLQQLVRLHLQFADERIKEVADLVEGGDTKELSFALNEYKEQIVATAPLIQKAQIAGEDTRNLIIETNDALAAHRTKLENLIEIAPIEFETAIRDTIDDAEEIQKVVVSPIPTEEPMVEATPEPFVFEPELPSPQPPTSPLPTIPATSAPPAMTETPGSFILPTSTVPPFATQTPIPSPPITATPTPGTCTPTYTPTHTRTPTPTPSRTPTPSQTPYGPTNTPDKRPPTATFIAE